MGICERTPHPKLLVIALSGVCILVVPALGKPSTARALHHTQTDNPPGVLRVVGHNPLFARGMNAGLALHRNYAYVGNRTDGSPRHAHPGVLVVDIENPARPKVVGEIGPPHEGNVGETSRELRVWRRKALLIVLNFACDPRLHGCIDAGVSPKIRFYDVSGRLASRPRLVSTYRPSRTPHEFFLWQDPNNADRALLFMSAESPKDLLVTDISKARRGRFKEIASWSAVFPDPGPDDNLHSVSVSRDGSRAYLAYLTAGFFILDTSQIAEGTYEPQIRSATPLENRAQWPGRGAHSAIKLPGREVVLTTDEVYGGSGADDGCPWGWARLIDIADETAPQVLSEYRTLPWNDPAYCDQVSSNQNTLSSFSSHNPTATNNLAFISWHSAGLQVISTEDPRSPVQAAEFVPKPLDSVITEDPALSSGPDKVVMWSYPIIRRGLVYVVDVRNGLYILEFRGPHESELRSVRFLEGNSNLGDAR